MKYVCLVYMNDEELSEAEEGRLINEALDNDDALRRTGNYVYSDALQAPRDAVSLRVRNSQLSATDGPFAETKEHLSGLIIIEARDLNEAIRLAGKIPMVRYGTIEVRPVRELERVDIGASPA